MKNKQSELLFYFTYINSPKFNITQQSVSALFMCAFIPMKQLISLMRLLKVHVFITEISCCVFGSKKILHTHTHIHTCDLCCRITLCYHRSHEVQRAGEVIGSKGFNTLEKPFSEVKLL